MDDAFTIAYRGPSLPRTHGHGFDALPARELVVTDSGAFVLGPEALLPRAATAGWAARRPRRFWCLSSSELGNAPARHSNQATVTSVTRPRGNA